MDDNDKESCHCDGYFDTIAVVTQIGLAYAHLGFHSIHFLFFATLLVRHARQYTPSGNHCKFTMKHQLEYCLFEDVFNPIPSI